MKWLLRLIGTIGFALAMLLARKAPADDLLGKLTVAPFASLKGAEITGDNTLGAGLDAGLGVNDFVSIHIANITLELNGWRSSVVDETEAYGRADFSPLKDISFVLYGKGGATRNWNNDAWALGVGVGAQYSFTKNVGIGADYTINAWFNGPEDKSSLARAFFQLSF
jgi:opacity protein-like surface antigen